MSWLVTLLYIASFAAAGVNCLWTAAFLGFAGEAHRSMQLTMLGRVTAIAANVAAVAAIAVTGWLLWRRLFSANAPPAWLPPVIVVVAVCTSLVLVKVFDGIGYAPSTSLQ